MPNNKKIIKLQSPFERLKQYHKSPEVNLCRAVILQMIIDATNISEDPEFIVNEKHAKEWLFGRGKDFELICDNAQLSKSEVRKLARDLIKSHMLNNKEALGKAAAEDYDSE